MMFVCTSCTLIYIRLGVFCSASAHCSYLVTKSLTYSPPFTPPSPTSSLPHLLTHSLTHSPLQVRSCFQTGRSHQGVHHPCYRCNCSHYRRPRRSSSHTPILQITAIRAGSSSSATRHRCGELIRNRSCRGAKSTADAQQPTGEKTQYGINAKAANTYPGTKWSRPHAATIPHRNTTAGDGRFTQPCLRCLGGSQSSLLLPSASVAAFTVVKPEK